MKNLSRVVLIFGYYAVERRENLCNLSINIRRKAKKGTKTVLLLP